jgi:hypothetical protein
MKPLEKRIAGPAKANPQALKTRRHETPRGEVWAQQAVHTFDRQLGWISAAVK